MDYRVNAQLDIPIYRQLTDAITAAIRKGELADGEKLPTVQELSDELSIARGTIKRAYDELELDGLICKVQGRGTFVSYQPSNNQSRKEWAMEAIDKLLDDMEKMNISPAEINIFFNLMLRQRAERCSKLKVALIECNPENLSHISEQLHAIENIDLYSFLLENVEQYPYKISDDFDLVISTQMHARQVEDLLPVKKRVARVALRLTPESLSKIIKLRAGLKVGVLGYSLKFGDLLADHCHSYNDDLDVAMPLTFEDADKLKAYLKGKDAVLLPEAYARYCNDEVAAALRNFAGQLICCAYELDDGSFLYIREKSKRLLEAKTALK